MSNKSGKKRRDMHNKDNKPKKRNYEHMHMHDHDHDFDHLEIPTMAVKDLALLEYMLDHNKQHANELADTAGRLVDEGFADAAAMINEAVNFFNQANVKMENAVALISESVEK